jgi:hypothetical protein
MVPRYVVLGGEERGTAPARKTDRQSATSGDGRWLVD